MVPSGALPSMRVRESNSVGPSPTMKILEAWFPEIVMPTGRAEASIVTAARTWM